MKILHEETIGGVRYQLNENGSVGADGMMWLFLRPDGSRVPLPFKDEVFETAQAFRARNLDRIRPLAENEQRTTSGSIRRWFFENGEVFSVKDSDPLTRFFLHEWHRNPTEDAREAFAFGLAWARRNCPPHLAVLDDGSVYEMDDDEARTESHIVFPCSSWPSAPLQRERVEAWRAKQAEKGEKQAAPRTAKELQLAENLNSSRVTALEKLLATADGTALGALAKAGIATPEEGYRKAGWGWLERGIDDLAKERDYARARVRELEEQAGAADECIRKLEGATDAREYTCNGTTYYRADHPRVLRADEFRWADGAVGVAKKLAVDEAGRPLVGDQAGLLLPWGIFSEHFPRESIAALRAYWLANYQFAPGEYLDEDAGVVRRREPTAVYSVPEPEPKRPEPFFTDAGGDEWEFVKFRQGWCAIRDKRFRVSLVVRPDEEGPVADALRAYVASIGEEEG